MYYIKKYSFLSSFKPSSIQRGFTLVEMAIVLVIVGLLLGGVLKGQELVVQARVKALVNDFNQITAAYYTYFDRYHRFPGDDSTVQTRWGTDATKGDSNGIIGDKNAGYVDISKENAALWQHLRFAGIVGGDTAATTKETIFPVNAVGGFTGIQEGGYGIAGTIICTSNVPSQLAELIDYSIDDGDRSKGIVRANNNSAVGTILTTAPTAAAYADEVYEVCRQL